MKCPYDKHLLQSNAWFRFQQSLGNSAVKFKTGEQIIYGLVENSDGKIGSMFKRLYIPYGPNFNNSNQGEVLSQLYEEAKKLNVSYIRIEPTSGITDKQLVLAGYEKLTGRNFQPANTSVIDLTKGWDKLIMEFRTSNRQAWRKAEAGSLIFEVAKSPDDIKDFWDMLQFTESRTGTHMKRLKYFTSMLDFIIQNDCGALVYAVHDGKRVAATIVFDDIDQKCRYYLYAASYAEARNVDAGANLVSYTVKDAIEKGFLYYDLFGVSPIDADQTHRWYGFSKFKRSFAGDDVEFLGTWEKSVSLRHKGLKVLRRIRK